MPTLSEHSNVHNTALILLGRKGYQVWEEQKLYFAEKDGWDFCADDPVQLLGLISIFDTLSPTEYSDYWWRIREPWIRDDVPGTPEPFKSVMGPRADRS